MDPRVEDDEIVVPLVDGISYAQLVLLSTSLGTPEIYVDVVPGNDSATVSGHDYVVLTISGVRFRRQRPIAKWLKCPIIEMLFSGGSDGSRT
jgi:hypothetical protein